MIFFGWSLKKLLVAATFPCLALAPYSLNPNLNRFRVHFLLWYHHPSTLNFSENEDVRLITCFSINFSVNIIGYISRLYSEPDLLYAQHEFYTVLERGGLSFFFFNGARGRSPYHSSVEHFYEK